MTNIIADLPIAVGQFLGITDPTQQAFVGGLLLSSLIIFGSSIAMNATKQIKFPVMIVGLFTISGTLAVINWLPAWILLIGVITVVAMFSGKLAEMFR